MSLPIPKTVKYQVLKDSLYLSMDPLFHSLTFEKWFQFTMFDFHNQMTRFQDLLIRSIEKSSFFQRYCSLFTEFSEVCIQHFADFMDYENHGPYHEGLRWDYSNHLLNLVRTFQVQSIVQIIQQYFHQICGHPNDFLDDANAQKMFAALDTSFRFIFQLEKEYEEYKIRKQSRYFPYLCRKTENWHEIEFNEEFLKFISYEEGVSASFLGFFRKIQNKYQRHLSLNGLENTPMTLEELDLSDIPFDLSASHETDDFVFGHLQEEEENTLTGSTSETYPETETETDDESDNDDEEQEVVVTQPRNLYDLLF